MLFAEALAHFPACMPTGSSAAPKARSMKLSSCFGRRPPARVPRRLAQEGLDESLAQHHQERRSDHEHDHQCMIASPPAFPIRRRFRRRAITDRTCAAEDVNVIRNYLTNARVSLVRSGPKLCHLCESSTSREDCSDGPATTGRKSRGEKNSATVTRPTRQLSRNGAGRYSGIHFGKALWSNACSSFQDSVSA